MTATTVHWVGTHALLVDLPTLDAVLALHAWISSHPFAGQIDAVPAACTLLLKFESHYDAAKAAPQVEHIDAPAVAADSGRLHEIEVIYDGADLADVARHTGLSEAQVIRLHGDQTWRAAFSGFAPGFVYLASDNPRLAVPRRSNPRTAVPAGAVALAGQFSAIYPRPSPGGWQLIGRTNARVWDLDRPAPALIQPGDTVRYIAVEQFSDAVPTAASASTDMAAVDNSFALEVVDAGIQSLIEDTGRPGLSRLGISPAGAADALSARQANRLVGNGADAALIETLLGGLAVKARGDLVLARSGALGSAHIDGERGRRSAPASQPFALHDGETLRLKAPHTGLRSYVAVRGGINMPPTLGSRAHDSLAAIGTPPLQTGQILPLAPARPCQVVGAAESAVVAATPDSVIELRVVPGPRDDWFDVATRARFTRMNWRVTAQSNRIGVRLDVADSGRDAAPLQRCRDGELDSEGMVAGAVQVPPSGLPVIFLQNHPVTGGYPVIAVVVAADLHRVAQLAPGTAIRFVAVTPDCAVITSPTPHTSQQHDLP